MAAISDVYEVTFVPTIGIRTFTIPAKYAYAIVQVMFDHYVSDQVYFGSYGVSLTAGTTKFIAKGGRVLRADEFVDNSNIRPKTAHLTIIGYLPT